jgi:PspC domain
MPVAGDQGRTGDFPMCWPESRSHASAMNTTTVNPEASTTGNFEPNSRTEPRYQAEPERTALRRPIHDRVLTGVAVGLAGYFGVDVSPGGHGHGRSVEDGSMSAQSSSLLAGQPRPADTRDEAEPTGSGVRQRRPAHRDRGSPRPRAVPAWPTLPSACTGHWVGPGCSILSEARWNSRAAPVIRASFWRYAQPPC